MNVLFLFIKKLTNPEAAKQEMEDKVIQIEYQEEEEDEDEKEDEEGNDSDEEDGEQDGEQEEDDDVEIERQNQPPMKVTKNFRGGQKKDYVFLKSVKSLKELNTLRFKNSCHMGSRKPLPTFKCHILPCTRKRIFKPGIQCQFELMAVRQQESGTIDVYSHSQHNHPIMPEERRASVRRAKELMPAVNPPRVFRTPDNIEWTFLRTFANYDQMQKFRFKSYCKSQGKENHHRIRFRCNCRRFTCEFKLLALKSTSASYHVYTFGCRNHPGHQQKQQEMEVDEDEEEDVQEENEVEEVNVEEEDWLLFY